MNTNEVQSRYTAEQAIAKMGSAGAGVRLVDFRILKRSYEIGPRGEMAQSTQLLTGQGLDVLGDNIVQVSTEFRSVLVPGEIPGGAGVDVSLSLAQVVGVAYEFPKETDPDTRLIVARIGGVMTAWPFWRTFMHTATAEAGMQVQFAPLLQPIESAQMAGFPLSLPS